MEIRSFTHDVFGNIVETSVTAKKSVTASETRTSETEYDNDQHLFPIKTMNALDHFSSATFNPKNGTVLTQTDANGHAVQFEYTALGRKTKEVSPTGLETKFHLKRYDGTLDNAIYYSKTESPDGAVYRKYFAKTGQVLRRQAPGFSSSYNVKVNTDFTYNEQGRLAEQTIPFFVGTSPSSVASSTYSYNPWGDIISETTPNNNNITEVSHIKISNTITIHYQFNYHSMCLLFSLLKLPF